MADLVRKRVSTDQQSTQTLAAAGELQRDLQRELTDDGLRAAEAKGSKGGPRPAAALSSLSRSLWRGLIADR
ncbi:hypothetical protein AR457_01595 [Streptomyces agglomeratus]|uniref:hypothetical protein n=1 Tax=Streptomyces agglomeratus TaxID=285458 RepID=UPI000854D89D|nr:hypothetical protein AR457_01595 [Streptomyces agglomeratus]OEJ62454.1 hypothetical protein BGM19_35085 [Streptomyces agglomeratus]